MPRGSTAQCPVIVLFIFKKSGNSLVALLLFDDALSSYARNIYLALSVLNLLESVLLHAKRCVHACVYVCVCVCACVTSCLQFWIDLSAYLFLGCVWWFCTRAFSFVSLFFLSYRCLMPSEGDRFNEAFNEANLGTKERRIRRTPISLFGFPFLVTCPIRTIRIVSEIYRSFRFLNILIN